MNHIRRIEQFTQVQKNQQYSEECWVLLNLGSLQRMAIALSSGTSLFDGTGDQQFALFVPRGSFCDYEYDVGREDWVIKLEDGAVAESDDGQVSLKWAGMDERFPACHPLDVAQVERCRDYLNRMLQTYHNPKESSRARLNLAFSALLDCVLNPQRPISDEEPAEALRRLIIADRRFEKTLSQLSFQCGYSSDHIRRLFEARFGTTPKSFRSGYRLGIARTLLEQGVTSVKVSKQLGFSSPAHFSAAFRKHFGQSPGSVT